MWCRPAHNYLGLTGSKEPSLAWDCGQVLSFLTQFSVFTVLLSPSLVIVWSFYHSWQLWKVFWLFCGLLQPVAADINLYNGLFNKVSTSSDTFTRALRIKVELLWYIEVNQVKFFLRKNSCSQTLIYFLWKYEISFIWIWWIIFRYWKQFDIIVATIRTVTSGHRKWPSDQRHCCGCPSYSCQSRRHQRQTRVIMGECKQRDWQVSNINC